MAEKLEAILTLDDKNYTVKMKGAGKLARAFHGDVRKLNATMKKHEGALRRSASLLHTWTLTLGQARNAINNIWLVTGSWMSVLVKSSAEIENLTKLLEGMADAIDPDDRIAQAARDLEYLMETAQNSPFSVSALSDSFVKFKSVGLDPATEGMQSLVDAVAAFGGTDETLARASIAIQQMAGKGVISMEELRQQLGEAVPQAITIMAQSMGVTYGELVDQISKGTVEANAALEAMFNGFEIAYGGRAVALMDTYKGAIAGLRTAFLRLVKDSEGIQNFFESVTNSIRSMADWLGSEAAMRVANAVGDMLARIVDGFTHVVTNFEYFQGRISAVIQTVNDSRLNPDGTLFRIVGVLENIIEAIFGVQGAMSEVFTDLGLETALGMTAEEFETSVYEDRIKAQADFLDREFKGLVSYREGLSEERENIKAEYERLVEDMQILRTNSNGDHLNNVHERGSIQSSGELFRVLQSLGQSEAELAELQTKLENNQVRQEQLQERMKKNQSAGFFSLKFRLEDEKEEAQALQDQMILVNEAVSRNELITESLRGSVARLQDDIGLTDEDLQTLLNRDAGWQDVARRVDDLTLNFTELSSGEGPIADASKRIIEIQDRLKEIDDLDTNIGQVIDRETVEQSEQMFQEILDHINDATLQHSAASSEVMAEAHKQMTDQSVSSSEQRFENASKTANDFFERQMNDILSLQAVTLSALSVQGEAGQIAMALASEEFSRQMSEIERQRNSLLKGWERGVVTTTPIGGGRATKAAESALKRFRADAEEAAERLQRGLVDPFTYELPNSVENLRVRFNRLANDVSGGVWTSEMTQLFTTIGQARVADEIEKIAEATRDWETSSKGAKDAREAEARQEIQRLNNMRERLMEEGLWRVEWEQTIQDRITAVQEQAFSETPLGQFANEWKDTFENMEQWGVDTMKSVGGELSDMVVDGKANFEDLARSVLKSFLQIQINAALSAATSYISGAIGFGGGTTPASVNHSGGIIGTGGRGRQIDLSAFANAPRFHTGGVIGQEVPAILEKGEGVFTREQMKALGANLNARSGTPDVKFNLINNSGHNLDSDEQNVRFDGQAMILDVVVKAAGRPGPFRDSLKRNLK